MKRRRSSSRAGCDIGSCELLPNLGPAEIKIVSFANAGVVVKVYRAQDSET